MDDDREYEAGSDAPEPATKLMEREPAPVEPEDRRREEPEPDYDASAPVEKEPEPEPEPSKHEDLARSMGWAPKEEWRGPEDKWVDADTFVTRASPPMLLERMEKLDAAHRETIANMERMNQRAIERTKKEADERIKNLEYRRDQLIEEYAGDAASIKKINSNYEAAVEEVRASAQPQQDNAPPTEVQKWVKDRPAFTQDEAFRSFSIAELNKVQAAMPAANLDAQLKELDKRLAPRFPEYYGEQAQTDAQDKQDNNGAPPAGSRSMDGVRVNGRKATRYADKLPQAARAQFDRFVKQGLYKKEELEDYAKEYVDQ